MDIEIQAIAKVTTGDAAVVIAKLPAHEISDFFMQVAEGMDTPEDISRCAHRLLNHCRLRFGFTTPDIPGFEGTTEALNKLGT